MAGGVELATAYVSLVVSGDQVGPGVRRALRGTEGDTRRAGENAGRGYSTGFSGSVKGVLAGFGVAAIAKGAIGFAKDAIAEGRESQKVGAQTAAVLKSTGGAANVSAAEIGNLATAISNKVGVDDEAIQSGENLLLTFTNIRNEAGKGNDIFNRATQVITDMGAALGTDAKTSAIQLGKALNDPIKGISALQRVGVSFTESQKNTIKSLVTSGKTLDAQKIILKELTKEFGGSAAAQATAGEKAGVAFGNLKEQVGLALIPVLDKAEGLLTSKVIPAVSKFVTQMQDGSGAGGEFAHALTEIYDVGKGVVSFLDGLPGPVKKFAGEALLAYGALRLLNGGLGAIAPATALASRGLSGAAARSSALNTAAYKLGRGLNQAAGVGGMLALYQASKQTSKGLGTLEGAAGGALIGLSVAGPVGAAVGGLGGALFGLVRSTNNSKNAFKLSAGAASSYASTLDQVTGSAKAASRAQVLENLAQNGTLKAGLGAGVSQRTLVDAALGKPAAIKAVQTALSGVNAETKKLTSAQKNAPKTGILTGNESKAELRAAGQRAAAQQKITESLKQSRAAAGALTSLLGPQAKAYATQASKARLAYFANTALSTVLKGFPKTAITKVKADGVEHSKAAVIRLAKQYNLTPKQIRTVAGLAGYDITLKKARTLKSGLDKLPGNYQASAGIHDNASPKISFIERSLSSLNGRTATVTTFLRTVKTGAKAGAAAGAIGARASGGPVSRGTYLVGENGPELHTFDRPGYITPNNKLAASSVSAPAAGGRQRLTVVIGQNEFDGYIDDRVYAIAGG